MTARNQSLSLNIKEILKWVPVLLSLMTAVIGGLWVVWKYTSEQNDARRREIEVRRFEAARPFYDKQLALYFEAAKIADTLATSTPDNASWQAAEQRFRDLYWSELSMVEDGNVESAMVTVSKALDEYLTNRKLAKSQKPGSDDADLKRPLNVAVLSLAHAIRDSIRKRWTQDLNPSP